MALSLSAKLKIKEGMTLIALHAPPNFAPALVKDIPTLQIVAKAKQYDQIHWFVTNRTQMEKELEKVISLLKENVVCWIYYPKKSSAMQTDLTRDNGWDKLLQYHSLQWISLVSFDETWSTFGMRMKEEQDDKKKAEKKPREIFSYIDSQKKTITLPHDFLIALKKNAEANDFFESLSFSNRKEYVEWIVSAKKEETRRQRVEKSIIKLQEKYKNPSAR